MALTPGTHIGPYEVVGSLGAGGMGEVYRARDTRLNRDVALKIVPETFALDADRLARFQREAQVLASLSHPNIAAIYGLEEATTGKALVLELVEGETLADRIARGPIPLDEALPMARQIAEALESAHDQGVVHRDLKPANVKVREDGTVKVLDFGLAKMLESESAGGSSSLSLSPTITTPAMTQMGMILGTAAYMSPEQARGRPADRRSDVWAFGCVLFEMLTGSQAFAGEDVTDTIAAVVRGEPPWQSLPADTPAPIRLLLQRCLEKDRRKRIGDISGVLFVLREPSLGMPPGAPVTIPAPAATRRPWKAAAAVAAALLLGGAISAGALWTLMKPQPPRVSRLVMTTGEQQLARNIQGNHVAISPDGATVVYIGVVAGAPVAYARRLDSFEATAIAQNASSPFFRPDGKEIGFFNQGVLRRVAITGGPSVEIVRTDGPLRGATWGSDDSIIYATGSPQTGLMRVAAAGGQAEVLTRPQGSYDHVWPRFLPDAKAILFTVISAATDAATSQIAALDLRPSPPQTKILIRGGTDARYLPSGHLVYLAGDSLRTVPFDLERLEVKDETASPVLSGMSVLTGGLVADLDVSASGTLAYVQPGAGVAAARTIAWVDRTGGEHEIPAPPRAYLYPRLSPDNSRVAFDIREGETDIWVWDLQRNNFTRVTRDPNLDRTPVWASNDELFYSSMRDGTPAVYRQRADGTGQPEKVTDPLIGAPVFSLSLTGNRLIVSNTAGGVGAADLMTVDVSREASAPAGRGSGSSSQPSALRRLEPLVDGPAGSINGTVSPDGRWLAYESNESGSWEVYVQPFGNGATGPRATVSTMGGIQPRWSPTGPELFYVSPRNEMMVIKVGAGSTWSATPPQRLFDAGKYFFGAGGNPFFQYDVARDGRFLMIKAPPESTTTASDQIVVVQHWIEELRRRDAR